MACVGADTSRGVWLRAVARSPGPARRQGCKGPLAGSRGQARCEGQPELGLEGKDRQRRGRCGDSPLGQGQHRQLVGGGEDEAWSQALGLGGQIQPLETPAAHSVKAVFV